MNIKQIRNFCIIAHIDHGKSTLADRFLEVTGTVERREMKEQLLDTMEIERERGITIKLQPVRMDYKTRINSDSNADQRDSEFILNLIDTPGHVDFSYEVSRSLAAVEGAVLLVDATQGVQAQTLANLNLAKKQGLLIIPVINKIDLPAADTERVASEIETILGIKKSEILLVSAKTGQGVPEILEAIVTRVPPPKGEIEKPLQALIFDSVFDSYKGVIVYVRVVNGAVEAGERLKLLVANKEFEAQEVGYFKPKMAKAQKLLDGEIGYIVTGLKSVREAKVGDTIAKKGEKAEPLAGYKKVKPFVFASFYTLTGEPQELREALEKLSLNDASLSFEPETSSVLGMGFRCGFLGLLHLEIVKERLEREYNLDLIATTPSVSYQVIKANKEEVFIDSPAELPDMSQVLEIREPTVLLEIIAPNQFLGGVMELTQSKRGEYQKMTYLDPQTVLVEYKIPLAEILVDFYDQLKQISSGYASLNWEFLGHEKGDLAKLDILIGGEIVEPLATIVPKEAVSQTGREIVKKLKEVIPRQNFEIIIQAAVGAKIVARENVPAFRKDVTAKLYGGDVTRKRKLLEKQKKGKKRMKRFGKIDIPQEAFMAMLRK